jgi:hypothetical protein
MQPKINKIDVDKWNKLSYICSQTSIERYSMTVLEPTVKSSKETVKEVSKDEFFNVSGMSLSPALQEKSYGSNEFVNRIRIVLKNKYDKEIATAMAEPAAVQQARLQSLLLIELLEEIRKLNSMIIDAPDSQKKG